MRRPWSRKPALGRPARSPEARPDSANRKPQPAMLPPHMAANLGAPAMQPRRALALAPGPARRRRSARCRAPSPPPTTRTCRRRKVRIVGRHNGRGDNRPMLAQTFFSLAPNLFVTGSSKSLQSPQKIVQPGKRLFRGRTKAKINENILLSRSEVLEIVRRVLAKLTQMFLYVQITMCNSHENIKLKLNQNRSR